MTTTIKDLKGRSNGLNLIFPGTPEYKRSTWTGNRLHWKEKPAFVVKPTNVLHVEAAVTLARLMKSTITVKSTGHSYAGYSNNTGGILLDMSDMRWGTVEFGRKGGSDEVPLTMSLSGGAIWGDAYKLLADNDLKQYTITGGRCPGVGVSGYTLGGGLGPFTRSFGMSIDQLKEVTIVTAQRKPVRTIVANERKNKELFWALRGGGGGNFGVVVEMKFALCKLDDSNGMVVTGRFTLKRPIAELIKLASPLFGVVIKKNKLTIDTTWICTDGANEYSTRYNVYFNGNWSNYSKLISDLFGADSDLVKELLNNTHEEVSTSFVEESLEEQWSDEQRKFVSSNNSYHLYSSHTFKNQGSGATSTMNKVIKEITNLLGEFRALTGVKDTGSTFQVTLIHGGGRARVYEEATTAFPWRGGDYFGYVSAEWTEKRLHYKGTIQNFIDQKCQPALSQYAIEKKASFINFTARGVDQDAWGKSQYGPNYEKLQELRRDWDPDEVFKVQQSIKPSSKSSNSSNSGNQRYMRTFEDEDPEKDTYIDTASEVEYMQSPTSRMVAMEPYTVQDSINEFVAPQDDDDASQSVSRVVQLKGLYRTNRFD